MKFFSIFFFSYLILTTAVAAPAIHTVSNIVNDNIIVEVNYKSQSLLELNLKSKKIVSLPTPKELAQNEILGLLLLEKNILLFSQNTSGGRGRNLALHVFNRLSKTWDKAQKIDCESFDTVEIHKNNLTLFCDANALTKKASSKIVIPFESFEVKTSKYIFPLITQKNSSVFYRLEGSVMSWNKIYFGTSTAKESGLTTEELLQAK